MEANVSSSRSPASGEQPTTPLSLTSFPQGWSPFTRVTPPSEYLVEQTVRRAHLDRHRALADFRYRPLKKGTNEIRLLHVTRQSRQETLFGRLEHAPLDEASYETVSYCWGDPTPCRVLVVDGARLLIPRSSWQALNRLAYDDEECTLWIDAVCINQLDRAERSQQVALMPEIYSHGLRNIVYLGEPVNEELIRKAFATMKAIYVELQSDVVFQEMLINLGRRHMGLSSSPIQIKWSKTSIHAFFADPWFRRLWVLQETCLAAENLCVLGRHELDFRVIQQVATGLRFYHSPYISSELYTLPGLNNAATAHLVHAQYRLRRHLLLGNALTFGLDLEASDLRDKVYGILGLVSVDLREVEALTPDYRKSWQDVYADATRAALRNTTARIFGKISHRDEADMSVDGLPSWVPRWHREHDRSVDTNHFQHPGRPSELPIRIDGLDRALNLEGWSICPVNHISDVATIQSFTEADAPRWFGQVAAMAHSVARESHDMLARTLIADCNWQFQRSTVEERLGYLTLVEYHADGRVLSNLADLSDMVEPPFEATRLAQFWAAVWKATVHRRFGISEEGHFLLVPKITQPSDIVIYLEGCHSPLVLRPNEDHFLLLGECYIDGLMRWQEGFDQFYEQLEQSPKITFEIH